jgi:hypothetical protein
LVLGFEEEISFNTGYAKFCREGYVVEFLMPLRGDGREQVAKVPALGVMVQGLRYLNYRDDEIVPMTYRGFTVKVPRPEIYAMFKFIVHAERKNPAKKVKDLATAKALADYLMQSEAGKQGLTWAYSRLTRKQQQTLMPILKREDPVLHAYFLQG